jgi:hypothetical protein
MRDGEIARRAFKTFSEVIQTIRTEECERFSEMFETKLRADF